MAEPFTPFHLERYFARHEHAVQHMLGASDCEALTAAQVLALAGMTPGDLLDRPLGYGQSVGDPALRAALAPFYPGCGPDDLLVCNAPQEAIFLCMQALLRAGDRVVVQTPCYQSLAQIARDLGCVVVEWPVALPDDGPQHLDLDRLALLLRERTTLLVTNAPHSPTGVQPTEAEWQRIAALVQDRGARWFADEMYRGLAPDDASELAPAASLVDGAVSLWGTSKSFGLPGLRIGWLASRDRDLLARIEARKDYTTICSSVPGEILARAALAAAPTIFGRNRARIAGNGARMAAFAAQHAEVLRWHGPQAGPAALCRVLGETATDHAARVRRQGGLLVPSSLFDLPDRWVRVGLGREGFPAALDRWHAALGE